ncbi:MAG: guanylate kinase [Desulfobulbus sp.]|jgi:guanylate kinase
MTTPSKGLLFVLSAPSGCGKTTLVNRVMPGLPGLVFSVSHTTRPPRPGEVDGVHYHFVSRQQFLALRDRQPSGFLEWAEVHGNLYGTGVEAVEDLRRAGLDVLLDIDVQGAALVRRAADPITIFIAPPSLAVLEARLRGRATEDEAIIATRLNNARKELAAAEAYEYLIVNGELETAVETLRAVILAERCRHRRGVDGRPAWAGCDG